jgi:hypothetical protein
MKKIAIVHKLNAELNTEKPDFCSYHAHIGWRVCDMQPAISARQKDLHILSDTCFESIN